MDEQLIVSRSADAQFGAVRYPEPFFIAASPCMRELRSTVARLARKRLHVLVTGETGTGKEAVVQALHAGSGRTGALKAINCGAIPRELSESLLFGYERGAFTGADRRKAGVFEEANGGTLFLDEIGELSLATQATLLRVLQEKRVTRLGGSLELEVDVRVAAATHQDLERRVAEGSFRQDLLYRLNTVTLHIPPLRERREDIEPLAMHFLARAAAEQGLGPVVVSDEVLCRLHDYHWPGNVRELRNAIEYAAAFCDGMLVMAKDLPRAVSQRAGRPPVAPSAVPVRQADSHRSFKECIRAYESELIKDALCRADGNITRAAELLRMPIRTLSHKIRVFGFRSFAR